jgi:hypothetical protein
MLAHQQMSIAAQSQPVRLAAPTCQPAKIRAATAMAATAGGGGAPRRRRWLSTQSLLLSHTAEGPVLRQLQQHSSFPRRAQHSHPPSYLPSPPRCGIIALIAHRYTADQLYYIWLEFSYLCLSTQQTHINRYPRVIQWHSQLLAQLQHSDGMACMVAWHGMHPNGIWCPAPVVAEC